MAQFPHVAPHHLGGAAVNSTARSPVEMDMWDLQLKANQQQHNHQAPHHGGGGTGGAAPAFVPVTAAVGAQQQLREAQTVMAHLQEMLSSNQKGATALKEEVARLIVTRALEATGTAGSILPALSSEATVNKVLALVAKSAMLAPTGGQRLHPPTPDFSRMTMDREVTWAEARATAVVDSVRPAAPFNDHPSNPTLMGGFAGGAAAVPSLRDPVVVGVVHATRFAAPTARDAAPGPHRPVPHVCATAPPKGGKQPLLQRAEHTMGRASKSSRLTHSASSAFSDCPDYASLTGSYVSQSQQQGSGPLAQ